MNMVQSEEVTKLMNEMMKMTIFQPSEKRQMLEDESKTFLDPNLIMDTRHRIFHEDLYESPTKCSILAETKKSLIQEEIKGRHLKREQTLLERELRKFEQDLRRSRPKFCESYMCSKNNIAISDDEDFWRTSSKAKVLINKTKSRTADQKAVAVQKKSKQAFAEASIAESKDCKRSSINEIEGTSFGSIKVTIEYKSNSESKEQRLYVLRSCFEALRENARNKQRLREIRINIQNITSRRNLRSCIRVWKSYVENTKKAQREHTMETKDSDTRKIEILIDTIAETQKELTKCRKVELKETRLNANNVKENEVKKRVIARPFIVESPVQNRLNAQKEIIQQQRMKLARQSKIIEELKLKQVQEEIAVANKETVNAAKETLTYCGQQTRRTLIYLMRQAGYRDKSLTAPLQVPTPPRFLINMEARTEARKNRIKLREELRKKKLEEKKRKEEAARNEEEQERKRLQKKALREARRVREEREQQRARERERYKELNVIAEAFYRKHLLRRYIMEPFVTLIEIKNNYMNKADDHYKRRLLQKAFVRWKMQAEQQNQIKIELATSLYNRNLMWYALQKWREMAEKERKKKQVAEDFFDMKLQNECFKLWKIRSTEYKAKRLKNEHLALEHYEGKLKIKYFNMWKKYPRLIPDIMESERIKNTWREIVQELVPDFNPRQRGVILED